MMAPGEPGPVQVGLRMMRHKKIFPRHNHLLRTSPETTHHPPKTKQTEQPIKPFLTCKISIMASAEPPASSPSLIYMPLVIALCIIASVVLALLALHSMIIRLCSGDRREASRAAIAGGVEKKVVEAIPIHAYTKKEKSWLSQNVCPVCLGELEEGALIKVLPNCHHIFHILCIDAWLAFHSTCPFCRCEITMSDSPAVPEDDGVSSGAGDSSSTCPPTSGSILIHFMKKLKLRSCQELQQNSQQQPSDGSSRHACVMV